MSSATVPVPVFSRVSSRRLGAAMWATGIATFGILYAPQGLLTSIAASYQLNAADASWVVSAATLGLAAAIIPWALLADRLGRRRTLRVAATSAAAIAITTPFLPGYGGLLAGRFLLGVALGGIPALAVAYLHEAAPIQRAAAAAGAYVAATSVGGLAGRLVAAPLGEMFGWKLSLELLGLAAAALTIFFALVLPQTSRHVPVRLTKSFEDVARQLVNKRAWPLYAAGAMSVGALVATFNALGFRLESPPYLLTATAVSLVFLTYLAGTLTSRFSGVIANRFGIRVPLVSGCCAITLGALISLAANLAVIVAGVLLITAGMFLVHATAGAAAARVGGTAGHHTSALYSVSYYCGSSLFGTIGATAWTHGGWGALAFFIATLGIAGTTTAALTK